MSREKSQHQQNTIAQSVFLCKENPVAKELTNKIRVLVKTKVFKMMKFLKGKPEDRTLRLMTDEGMRGPHHVDK